MKVIIAGSRTFDNFFLMEIKLKNILAIHLLKRDFEIIQGGAKGADSLAKEFAIKYKIKCHQYDANWERDGRIAGFIRNERMAKNATHCICFWDGYSLGTKNMIELAYKYELQLRVVNYSKRIIDKWEK